MKKTLGILLVVALFLGFMAWRFNVAQSAQRPVSHAVLIADRSVSTYGQCEALLGLTQLVFTLPGMGKGSTLSVLLTGDKTSGNEPASLASYEVPFSNRVMEQKKVIQNRQGAILKDLAERCERIVSTGESPVLLAVSRGVEQLRGLGCKPEGLCYLYASSDGLENSDAQLAKALKGERSKNTKPPAKIDNRGIHIVLCGLAALQDKRQAHTVEQTETLKAAWQVRFTDTVEFQPFCPSLELPTESAAADPDSSKKE